MKYQAKDFLRLRNLILGNSVLNHLLVAHLLKQETPVFVGKSLTRIYGEKLKREIRESKSPYAKVPRFIMVDIWVSLKELPATIFHTYKDFSPVYQKHNVTLEDSYIAYLKKLATSIATIYSLNAAKEDKIFSKLPKSLSILLESNKVSSNYWKTGFSKRIKEVSLEEIDEKELEKYHEELRIRLSHWRSFNLILIELIKNKAFSFENPEKGKVCVHYLSNNQLILYYYSSVTKFFNSHIIEIKNLSPVYWDSPELFLDIIGKR